MILIDTGVLAAFFNKRDTRHKRARELMNHLRQGDYGTGIISDYILDETVTLLYVRSKRPDLSIKVGELIINGKLGQFIPLNADLVMKTWGLYQKYVHNGLSFTDCSLIALGHFLDVREILSFSEEFQGILNRIS